MPSSSLANQANGSALPPHFDDQLGLYTGLVFGSPALTHDQIPNYFKDATFGCGSGTSSRPSTRARA